MRTLALTRPGNTGRVNSVTLYCRDHGVPFLSVAVFLFWFFFSCSHMHTQREITDVVLEAAALHLHCS